MTGVTRIVAVKSLHAKIYNRYMLEFEEEIKMMLTLSHVNIVQVIGYLPQRDTGQSNLDREGGCQVATSSSYFPPNALEISNTRCFSWRPPNFPTVLSAAARLGSVVIVSR